MIVEWLLDVVMGLLDWILELFPNDLIPSNIQSPDGVLTDIAANITSMGVWVPWTVVAGAALASLGVWIVTFVIKVIRQIIAHVPQIGGSG